MAERDARPEPHCDDLDFSERIRFADLLRDEYREIDHRRKKAGLPPAPGENGRPLRMTGLALSGGGIRSATFNLGVLQALAAKMKLASFDYLSTVSGGGYTGGWWSAWLARDERDKDPNPSLFPPRENIVGERDQRRATMEQAGHKGGTDRQQVKDSAITAADDPIHHLRLFSNFITPRKGILSADTWRAIAITGRNIVLTWLILLPIILAAIMIGQAWFALTLGESKDLIKRFVFALAVPVLLLFGTLASVLVWIVATRRLITWGDKVAVTLGGIVCTTLTAIFLSTLGVSGGPIFGVALLLIAWIIYVFIRLFWWQFTSSSRYTDTDYWRNRLVLIQTKTLAYAVFAAVILLFAGFGHVLFDFLLHETTEAASKAGGLGALALSLISAAYTAYKASPTGGADQKTDQKPSLLQRIAFAVAPILFILTIGIVLSWVGNALYELVRDPEAPHRLVVLSRGALVAAFLFLVFALYEFRPRQKWLILIPISVLWISLLYGALTFLQPRPVMGAIALGIVSAVLFIRSYLRRRKWIAFYAIVLGAIAYWFSTLHPESFASWGHDRIPQVVVAGVMATLSLLLLEVAAGRGANTRCIALSIIACTMFVLIGATMSLPGTTAHAALTIVALVSIILGWVLALGWLADPNALTIHAFYKARLVRAYMGASNPLRAQATEADITDAVPGDDVLLTKLRNTDRGAPYHLVNTMLNLVGSGDLATQARSSESFLMSKNYCGSIRTGFRRTDEYSCGLISLGTAVAVSGAAASPSMGAQTPSAALSALLTLFNVRTGYWAPTPSMSYWRSGSTRLWPVYTLQELVSQTTDLLPYCYLTDGGHYENTGAYSLIQRGCNLIVVGECGADPKTVLEDLGNLIRKVRIDFAAEVVFDDEDIRKLRSDPPGERIVIGKIYYNDRHMKELGLPASESVGTIIIMKPNLSGSEPVDVKQYGFLNSEFPQQNTFDLSYDEAQFESYRRLGQLSGELAAARMDQWTAEVTPKTTDYNART